MTLPSSELSANAELGAHSTRLHWVVEEAQVIVHEADQPDVIGDFAHSDGLTGKDLVEIDLASAKAQATALRDDDGAIVEGILQRGKIRAGALGRPVELCRVVHVQSLMRPLA